MGLDEDFEEIVAKVNKTMNDFLQATPRNFMKLLDI